jgi:hypothetical protein
MDNCLTFKKSKYPIKGINIILLTIYCILIFGGIVAWRVFLFGKISKIYLLIYMYITVLLCYSVIYYLKKQQLSKMEYVSNHSKRCFDRTKKCLYYLLYLIIVVVALAFFPSKMDGSEVYNLSVLFFIGIVGYMLMNYQFVVGFGNKGYISGDGSLYYDEIEKIEELKRLQTADGILVYSKIKLFENNKICYDKFLAEEYTFLVNKTANRR